MLTMPTNFNNKRVNKIWSSKTTLLGAKHPNHVHSSLNYFKTLKKKFENRTKIASLFATQTATLNCALEASCNIFLLKAKNGEYYTIGKQLLKSETSVFVKKVLQNDEKARLLSNSFSSRRSD